MPARKRSKRGDSFDALVFLIPCFQFVQIKLIGTLNGSDVMLLVVFLYLALSGRIRIATPVAKRFLVFGSLWLVSQCVTDYVRQTTVTDYLRGWSNIGVTLISFVVLCTLLYGRPRRLALYGWGFVAGSLLRFFINPSEFAKEEPWKFGISFTITLAVLLFASSKKCRGHWPITLSAIIGVINIFLGTRGQGGICLVAALYLLLTRPLSRKGVASSKLRAGSLVTLTATIALGAAGVLWSYQYAALSGILGQEARHKYVRQSGGEYGVLLGGRMDLVAAIAAIYNSPILGHGSWAKDPTYLIIELQEATKMGYIGELEVTRDDLKEGLIPAHSYLLQAWVDAGILGAFFWAWVFVVTARMLIRVYPRSITLLPVMSFFALSLLWGILFSPYGAEERIFIPYYFVMLMTCADAKAPSAVRAAPGIARRKVSIVLTPRPQS